MSVRTKILALLDTLMRIPPLFLIDEILKNYNNNFQFVWNIEEASSNYTELNDQNYTDDPLNPQDRVLVTTNLNLYIFLVILCKTLLCLLGKKIIFHFFLHFSSNEKEKFYMQKEKI